MFELRFEEITISNGGKSLGLPGRWGVGAVFRKGCRGQGQKHRQMFSYEVTRVYETTACLFFSIRREAQAGAAEGHGDKGHIEKPVLPSEPVLSLPTMGNEGAI